MKIPNVFLGGGSILCPLEPILLSEVKKGMVLKFGRNTFVYVVATKRANHIGVIAMDVQTGNPINPHQEWGQYPIGQTDFDRERPQLIKYLSFIPFAIHGSTEVLKPYYD